MKWYQLDIEEIEDHLQVKAEKGLSYEQVEDRRRQFGENVVESDEKISKWLIFIKQFQDFMVLILLGATLIAGMLGEFIDAIAIMVIVFINGFIGFFQEQRAEKSLEKLKELSAPITYVLRDEKWEHIPSQNLVVGDVIRLHRGDRVTADVRIIKSHGLETEESALTGESIPVMKQTEVIHKDGLDAQDQVNMAFMGTLVTRGSGLGIVVGTGMNTVMGQIATLISTAKKTLTPLEHKLTELGKILIAVVLILTGLVVFIGVYQGNPMYEMFLAGVSLAVAAIPEGLPAIVTVALSLGVQRMIRRKAVVRKLSAVETLGCASVICSDKTGTITENEMTVKTIFINNEFLHITGDGYDVLGDFYINQKQINSSYPNLKKLLLYGMICNHANLYVKRGKYVIDGDPTDGALLVAARKIGLSSQEKDHFKIVKEFPFDPVRKRMSVVIEDENKRRFLITKGAPDILLPRTSYVLNHHEKTKLTNATPYKQAVGQMAKESLRTIAIAMKPLAKETPLRDTIIEKDLTLLGIVGMIDPPRQEVKQSIKMCQQAGIKTIMITGDHEDTARAIATDIRLLPEHGRVLTGYELNEMTIAELRAIIDNVYVFARVTPEHKLKIVEALQQEGHIVAMTGDGVNDAPAIKASDIGISMGLSGTDVTKEASSLILMDDNFQTIQAAIQEGRNIYENIRKFIRYLLASNVGEIFVMLFAMLFAYPLPLVPVQILWVNLVTDGLPAMALGLDQPEDDVMQKSPRNPREGIFARGLGYKIISRGFLIGIVSLIGFMIAYHQSMYDLTYARTVAFSTLVLAQLIHVFDCRSEKSVFMRNPFENLYLVFAVLSSLLLLLAVIYIKPLQPVFHTMSLHVIDWLLITGLSFIPTVFFGFKKDGTN